MDPATAKRYLEHFGYLSVADFQHAAGLAVDDQLGPVTMRAMEQPRCAVRDDVAAAAAASGARDPGRDYERDPIIYRFDGWIRHFDQATMRHEFAAAFASWSAVCGVAGREAMSGERAELVIDVRTRRQDRMLDGPGRTLAYAIVGGGLIVFDGDETWRPQGSNSPGIRFQNVAAHELGHTLNFYHSRIDSALMAPVYSSSVVGPVSPDDIERGRKAYGDPFEQDDDSDDDQHPGDGFTGTIEYEYENGNLQRVEAK